MSSSNWLRGSYIHVCSLISDICANNTCNQECDPTTGDCTCSIGYTIDGDNCLLEPDSPDYNLKASIVGDPHVMILDSNQTTLCLV